MPTFSEIIVLASFRMQRSNAWYQDDSAGNLPPRTHTRCRLLSVPLLPMKEVLLLNCSSWHSAPFTDQTNRHLGCNKLVHSQNNNKYRHENTIVFTWKWSNYILAGWLFQFSTTGKNKSYKKEDNYRRDETQAFAVGSEVKELFLILPKECTVK